MAYIIKARFYAGPDQTGESYVITSDNNLPDTRLEVGKSMKFIEAQPEDSADNAPKTAYCPYCEKALSRCDCQPDMV